ENLFGSGKQFFSSTHRLIVDRKFLIITSVNTEDSKHIIIEKDNKHVTAKNFILHLEYSKIASPIKFNDSGNIAYFDTDKISFPLTLRVWKKGDYFYPIGMYKKPAKTVGGETNPALKPAKKKVSDVLTNMKVNLHEKENTFVLLNDDRIIWLVGLRQDERFKVSKNTKHLLKIKMLPG
ncbi:MAG: hypothetical protein H7Y00_09355, partial [Fimbriimonadaceae bacterium]|nr:hypothetical protein [Chitinophagales bacterium]